MIIDGIKITVEVFNFDSGIPDHDELKAYVNYVKARRPDVSEITVVLCEDGSVDLKYIAPQISFERIRRITGYLVGTVDRWNDSKRTEEKDRVKHL